MRLGNSRQSNNVEDRRSGGPRIGGRGTIGIGTIVLALVAMYFGVDPRVVLDMASPHLIETAALPRDVRLAHLTGLLEQTLSGTNTRLQDQVFVAYQVTARS